jgi:hypothetical protein
MCSISIQIMSGGNAKRLAQYTTSSECFQRKNLSVLLLIVHIDPPHGAKTFHMNAPKNKRIIQI